MKAYPGVGERIRERMLMLGYKQANGEPDVTRFGWDFRIEKTLMYAWLRETMTPTKDLGRLCEALDCSIHWLLLGTEYQPKKAAPARSRQQRGKVRGLLLALGVALGALVPPPSVAGGADAPPIGDADLHRPAYRKLRRLGMVYA
jgi:hypothetical protein